MSIPLALQAVLQKEVVKMLQIGVIEESHSPWSRPPVTVPKPDGSVQVCIDFQKLNADSSFDAYITPCTEALLHQVGKATFPSMLDLVKEYWQIPLRETDKNAFWVTQGCGHLPKVDGQSPLTSILVCLGIHQ